MTTDTDGSGADHREDVFAALDALDAGESTTVPATADADVVLHQYQFTRGDRLEWDEVNGDADGNGDDGDANDGDGVHVTKGDPLADDELLEFDVRDMPPQRRHEVLTETFDLLESGDGFVLVNDHDPNPLYYELRSTRGDVVDWEDREENPAAWKTAIEKTAAAEGTDDPPAADATGDGVAASFDVREIPKPERHPTIHHRYGNIPAGATLEIVAPHEPVPLRREFEGRYGDAFSWDVREQEPGRCRVHVTKEESGKRDNSDTTGADAEPDEDVSASTDADDLAVTDELDVRDRPPAERHERIYDAYGDLDPGEGFVLVNDHDPKPLYHQFDAEAGDEFRWEYRQKEPGEFRVLIGKAASASDGEATGAADPEAPF